MQWVLSRGLCSYRCLRLAHIPKGKQSAAVNLDVAQASPFLRTGFAIVWHGDNAFVWMWDAQKVEAAQREAGVRPGRPAVIPETLLHPQCQAGECLVAGMEGFEGQYWRQGVLEASRWWPQAPSAADWLNFQRDAGIPTQEQSTQAPSATPLTWLPRPWAKPAAPDSRVGVSWAEQLTVAVILAALVGGTFWYGAQLRALESAGERLEVQHRAALRRADPILQARGAALEQLDRIETLDNLNPYPSQSVVMARIAALMQPDHATLQDWSYELGELKFSLASANTLLSSQYVKALLGVPAFSEVRALPGMNPKSLSLSVRLVPHVAVAATKGQKPSRP